VAPPLHIITAMLNMETADPLLRGDATLATAKRQHVMSVLDACGGNRTEAARVLKVDRKTLYRMLLKWGVPASR